MRPEAIIIFLSSLRAKHKNVYQIYDRFTGEVTIVYEYDSAIVYDFLRYASVIADIYVRHLVLLCGDKDKFYVFNK